VKWFLEITDWKDTTPNGVYLLDDSKTKMYAFRSHGGKGSIKVFKNPIKIDVRGRKFVVNPVQFKTKLKEEEPEGRVWTVKGSKGDEYRVTESGGNLSCTCSGFRFRGTCKHSESIRQTV
jgi:flagellin-like hook-associated protein FlgL